MCREELINFDKYIFNKDGSIISKHWNKKLSGWIDEDGYLVSCLLLKNGNRQPYRVNRVIAYLFVPRPEHLKDVPYDELQVGHDDIDRKNNNVSNLYWCTSKENVNHPLTKEKQIGREPWNKGVKGCFTEETLIIMREKSKGRKHSNETKAKQSLAIKKYWDKHRLTDEERKRRRKELDHKRYLKKKMEKNT